MEKVVANEGEETNVGCKGQSDEGRCLDHDYMENKIKSAVYDVIVPHGKVKYARRDACPPCWQSFITK